MYVFTKSYSTLSDTGSNVDIDATRESISARASSGGHFDLSNAGIEPSLQSAREQWKYVVNGVLCNSIWQ